MILKTEFTHHKQVIVGSHIASKIIMMTPSKPNFLISKTGKFSLGRNCLTHILLLLLSFLNFLECTDVKNLKTYESLFLVLNYATLLNFSLSPFRSSLHYANFPLPPTFYNLPSFFFPPHLTNPTNCLPFKFP